MASNSENERLIDEVLSETAQEQPEAPEAPVQEETPEEEVPEEEAPEEEAPEERTPSREHRNAPPRRSGSGHSGSKKKKRRKRRKHKSAKIYGTLIMLTLVFVISISLSVGIIEVGKDMLGIDGSETLVLFNIPEGATTADIAEDLHEQGIIRIPRAFIYFSRLSKADASYVAGDHTVSSAMAYETLISELTGTAAVNDDRESVDIMFKEGITLVEAANLLEENEVCDGQKFLYYFNAGGFGYKFEDYLPTTTSKLKFYKMEGYFFPDTYTFYKGTEPDDVCRKVYMNFDVKLRDADYARMDELGVTLDEIITLASMIQAEAANDAEMPDISSVFWNRLNDPAEFSMLQSDPTTKYVNQTIKPNIALKDENIYAAYDTYQCTGLPAGAIGNPGLAAIQAALYPNETDYYYFYANIDTHVTYFARTLEEHNANIEMVKQQQEEAAAAADAAAEGEGE
ncbi:MAG: endolytic transglycosylase MltG [Oscillospiraceae bacterium]|nr:endolytic transglycosylase MltG [Oscillospiraceae bacterium]